MNYKEQVATGASWTRCAQVTIENPYGMQPHIQFRETRCTAVGDTFSEQFQNILVQNFDPSYEIELRDPRTGEPTGETITHGALYAALYSAYMQAALARDAAADQPQELAPLIPLNPTPEEPQ